MDELNNKQIILLTMLVSFVVSTATGIMTVAMLEEAPQTLTQTVNRVVERTIERVVTGTSTPEAPTPVTEITKEVTIFAKEDDLIVSAVEKNQPRIARIYGANTATSSAPDTTGFVVSRDGIVVADAKTLGLIPSDKGTYIVQVGDREYVGTFVQKEAYTDLPVAFISLTLPEGTSIDAVSFGSDSAKPKVAQTAVILGGENGLGIFKATVAKLVYIKPTSTSSPITIGSLETSAKIPVGYEGALVVNLDGQAIGIVVDTPDRPLVIYPASRILSLMMSVVGKEEANKEGKTTNTATTLNAR